LFVFSSILLCSL
jgi:hypothetical protein